MEPFLDNLKIGKESKFEILGSEHQSLQLVLFPGDSIVTPANTLIYMSANVKKRNKVQSIKDTFMNFLTVNQGEVEYYNDTDTIGYLGISRRIGKVIVINAGVGNEMCFKAETLLAYTPGLTLDKKQKFIELGLRSWDKFKPVLTVRNQSPQIFLQTSHGLIEKELGQNEEIVLNRSSVFAFSARVKFNFLQPNARQYTSPLVKVKGPGLIYIENRLDSPNTMQNYKRGLLILAVFWMYLLVPLLMWPF